MPPAESGRLAAVGALAEHEVIRQCVGVTGIEVAHLIQSMVIFKSARFGAAVPWHQDATYLISTPQSVFGLWIALEDATLNNGCLWVAPGHHRSPLRELYKVDWASRSGLKHPLHDQPWPMESEAIPLEVKAGSVVIFHDHMPHKSEMNISEKSRRALTFHCHDSRAAWSAENWLHRRRLSPHLISAMAEL